METIRKHAGKFLTGTVAVAVVGTFVVAHYVGNPVSAAIGYLSAPKAT